MSNPNKHKPLSPEELFKLLDNQSNKASDFDELDDFEREALEGFSAHSDAKKAHALTEELNLAISQKASGAETKETKKNKVIWFSAAASIVVLIMISVFFFNQSKEESQSNIALNEAKEGKKEVIFEPESVPPTETAAQATLRSGLSADIAQQEKEVAKALGVFAGPKKESEISAEISNESSIGYSENKPVLSPAVVGSKDEAKNKGGDDYDALQKQTVLADKIEANEKLKTANFEQEKIADDQTNVSAKTVVSQNSNAVVADTKNAKEEDYKAEVATKARAKKSAEKQSISKEQATGELVAAGASYTKSDAAPAQGSTVDNNNNNNNKSNRNEVTNTSSSTGRNNNSAYYTGSEVAIRDFVLNYLKEHKSSKSIAGHYKISGTVSTDGKLRVNSITQITKVNCLCEDIITEALNAMTKWNAASQDGKHVSSNVEFNLFF